jgi:translocation and assembly module TamB
MRRFSRIAAISLGGLVLGMLLAVVLILLLGNTGRGRLLIADLVDRLSAHRVHLLGLAGSFPSHLELAQLSLTDERGEWLHAAQVTLDWKPLALLRWQVRVDRLTVARLAIERAPQSSSPAGAAPSIPHIELGDFSIGELALGAPLVGTPARLAMRGRAQLRSLEDATAELLAQRLDGPGDYRLHLKFDPQHLEGTLDVEEPASGPLEHLLALPGLGALSAHVRLAGARRAERLEGTLSAGALSARTAGRIDLDAREGDLELTLHSTPLAPRDDLRWERLEVNAHVSGSLSAPVGEGRLEVSGLRTGDALLSSLGAEFKAKAGIVEAHAQLAGVQLPGPAPQLLASEPVAVSARLALAAPDRALELTATHRLFSLQLHARTRDRLSAQATLRAPDLAPLASLAGQAITGDALLSGELEQRATAGAFSVVLKGTAANLQGSASWVQVVDHRLAFDLKGEWGAQQFSLERLRLTAPGLDASLSGTARRADPGAHETGLAALIARVQMSWSLDVARLEVLSSEIKGDAHAAGRLEGPANALDVSGQVRTALSVRGSPTGALRVGFEAHGLPRSLSGTLTAQGSLDAAPLEVDAALEPAARGMHVRVRRADWKSAHLSGELLFDPQRVAADRGSMHLTVGTLEDFDRILGTALAGRVEGRVAFTPGAGRNLAHLELNGTDLHVGNFAGALRLTGQGDASAVSLDLAATLPGLVGNSAALNAAGVLDLQSRMLRIDHTVLRDGAAQAQLLEPATLHFAQGLALEHVVLGMEGARLSVQGRVYPELELGATLAGVDAAFVNDLWPNTLAAGALHADAQLTGRLASPRGQAHIEASRLKLASDDAAGLPSVNLSAAVELAGSRAQLDGRVTARGETLLALTGEVPMEAAGSYDLKAAGKFDFKLVNPLLEARGMHASGKGSLDASIGGTRAAPQIHGTFTLEQGALRDYVRGIDLTELTAQIVGSENQLVIEHLTARAGSGTVAIKGTLNPLERGIPLALDITATGAQPISSNLITLTLDSTLTARGTLLDHIDVAGSVHIDKAIIGIPDSLPPEVAVLDVRRRGQAAKPVPARPLAYAFDITVKAPNQVLVQGRGLDAELGGELHLGGTSDEPQVTGGFDLERGTFSIGGSTLKLKPPGRVSFEPAGLRTKIDPTINFTAESTVADVGTAVTAKLTITGYADAPKFEFSSQPERPPDEIMALLLFGQPPGQLSALQLAQIGAALATLTGVGGGGPNPLVKLQRTLGLDRLTVGSNTTTTATGAIESNGAAIAAGRYITRRVYVEGRQTTTGETQVQVDVDLTKHLKLQTRLGNGTAVTQGTTPENDPGSSIGLSYQFEY